MEIRISMIVRKDNLKYILIFTLLVLLQERFFFLTGNNLVMVISICGLLIFIKKWNRLLQRNYVFNLLIIAYFIIQVYGIFLAYFRYNQPLSTGFIGTHYIFIYGFYFLFVDWFRRGNEERKLEVIKNAFIFFGVLFSILLIVQALIYPTVIFSLSYSIRNGLRVQGCQIIQFSFVVAVCDAIYSFRPQKIIPIAIMGYELFFVNQSRNVILLMSAIIIFLFYRRLKESSMKKFIIAILFIPILVLATWNMGLGDVISEIVLELQTVDGTSGMRVNELMYYLDLFKKSKYWGIGILGDQFPLRSTIYGINVGYYMEDIGVSAFVFKTGILGLLWLIFYLKKLGKMVKYTSGWIKLLTVFIFLKTIFSMFFSVSFIFDIKEGLIYLVILLAMIDANVNQNLEERRS